MTATLREGPILLSASDVRRLLPMPACIDAMDRAMRATTEGRVAIAPRRFEPLVDGSGTLGLMPGSTTNPAVYGAKVVSIHPANPAKGLPMIQGLVILFDHGTGRPVAVMDGAEITGIRTAAASGLATRELANPEARTLGILGYGVQAANHIDAVLAVRKIATVLVWGRSQEKAKAFVEAHAARIGIAIQTASQEQACGCDVVCATTSATQPVLFGKWLKPGSHINLVGTHTRDAREADGQAIAHSAVYVDLMESARNEAGDILMAVDDGLIELTDVVGEIGQVLNGAVRGRLGPEDITLYKSVGIVSQDLFAADSVYRAALAEAS